jgi:antitoxin MazE
MRKRVGKWGNSLAVRIPQAFAAEAGLEEDTQVELSLVNGQVVIVPISEVPLRLEHLLEGVTEENLHDEVTTGPAVGKEVW